MSEATRAPATEPQQPAENPALAAPLTRVAEPNQPPPGVLPIAPAAANHPAVADTPTSVAPEVDRLARVEMQEIAHLEGRVGEGLGEILAELPGLIDGLPPDAQYDELRRTAGDFVEAVRSAGIAGDLEAASEGFAGLDGKEACPAAERALEKMEALVRKCSPSGGMGIPAFSPTFQPSLAESMSSSVAQILSAMGMGSGPGSGGGSGGYGAFAEDVALYGPHAAMAGGAGELAGGGAGGGPEGAEGRAGGFRRDATDARDPALGDPAPPARVRLERDARFPLRYRELVGEYFRVMAETFADGE